MKCGIFIQHHSKFENCLHQFSVSSQTQIRCRKWLDSQMCQCHPVCWNSTDRKWSTRGVLAAIFQILLHWWAYQSRLQDAYFMVWQCTSKTTIQNITLITTWCASTTFESSHCTRPIIPPTLTYLRYCSIFYWMYRGRKLTQINYFFLANLPIVNVKKQQKT